MSSENGLLQAGHDALRQERYIEAIELLEEYCIDCQDPRSQEYLQAQMWLVTAYYRSGQNSQAKAICHRLTDSKNPEIASWAQQTLNSLENPPIAPRSKMQKANRAATTGLKLAMAGTGNLTLASGITISLLLGMVLVLALGVFLIAGNDNPSLGFTIAVAFTLIFNLLVFFLSPWIMDLTQSWLYHTRWVTLAEIDSQSPETAALIERVCTEKKIKQPRLGIIDDENPTAFTYGSLPNTARLVVSQGLFTYLDDDEVATVFAHELGHIVHWDFAVMTLASTLVQITYLIYTFARRMSRSGNEKAKDAFGLAAIVAYTFYIAGTYLVLYLSRTREYFADRFAAESTGNPNGLSRALVKIAYGIVEEGQRAKEPSQLMEGTRALGIYDHKAATSTGTAYRIASEPQKIGRIFLWDLFNPWGWWMELNSTHPLTGKRVRALSTYAEQLGLEIEFDMGRVVGEGRTLNKGKLYGNFALDLLLYGAETLGIFIGLIVGLFLVTSDNYFILFACPLIGFGLGILFKILVMFPNYSQAPATDVLTLMSDPYASPLRGQPAKLEGTLIGRGDSGYVFGSDLMLKDPTGLLYLRYASRFGPLGNFLFGMNRVQSLIGMQVSALGWFRRGVAPWVDLIQLNSENGTVVNSYHRFWSFILGAGAIIVGIVLALK